MQAYRQKHAVVTPRAPRTAQRTPQRTTEGQKKCAGPAHGLDSHRKEFKIPETPSFEVELVLEDVKPKLEAVPSFFCTPR